MKSVWFAVSVAFLIAYPTPAQNSSGLRSNVAPSTQRQDTAVRNLASSAAVIDLVVNTAAEVPLWTDKKAAVWFLANAAELVWDDHPGQAQTWLKRAWKLTGEVSDSPPNEKLKEFFTRSERVDSRTLVLGITRKHDSKLADEFLKELAESESREKTNKGAFDDRTARSEQLLQMAEQVVSSNPEVAFALAERSLADGISYSMQNVLTGLRLKDVELANRLFDADLIRFSASVPDPSEAQVLAGYLFQSGFTFSANSNGQTILVINPAHQNLPPVALAESRRANAFLVAAYQTLLSRPLMIDSQAGRQQAEQILILGTRLVAQYDSFDPELAPSTRASMAQLRQQLYPQAETTTSESSSARSDSNGESTKRLTKEEIYDQHISALEEKADRQNDPISRKLAYVEAAVATTAQDYQRALLIVEKIEDDDLRNDATAFLLYRASLFLLGRGDVDKATELKQQVRDFSRQAVLDIAIAQHFSLTPSKPERKEIDRQRAFDLLSEVQRGLERTKPSPRIAKIALARTAVLARLDKTQALAALAETLQLINGLESFDLRDGSAPSLGLDDSISGATVATPKVGFDFRTAIEPLLKTNFAEITAAAETLRIKEVRGVALLEIARLLLNQIGHPNTDSQLTLAQPRN